MKSNLPAFLKSYFWDVDFEELDSQKDASFIIKRVIDRGNTQALNWVIDKYSLDKIKDLVLSSRDLSRKTALFWTKIMSLNPSKVPCLLKPYSPIPFGV